MNRYLVVLTDVRPLTAEGRDERTNPERRRQTVVTINRESAMRLAAAFSALGMVRAGRQRVKVIALGRHAKRHKAKDTATASDDDHNRRGSAVAD